MIVDIYASGTDCIIESKEYTGKALTVAGLLAECAPKMKRICRSPLSLTARLPTGTRCWQVTEGSRSTSSPAITASRSS